MKVKVGDRVTTDAGDGEIMFIGTQLVVYRDEAGEEWTEYGYEQTAVVPCEIDFVQMPSKKEKK